MDMTKSREEFEAYICKNLQYPTLEMEPEDGPCTGEYVDTMREEQFQLWNAAWKASRESIEVELPAKVTAKDTNWTTPIKMREALALSLRTAGIRIKGESE